MDIKNAAWDPVRGVTGGELAFSEANLEAEHKACALELNAGAEKLFSDERSNESVFLVFGLLGEALWLCRHNIVRHCNTCRISRDNNIGLHSECLSMALTRIVSMDSLCLKRTRFRVRQTPGLNWVL